MSEPTEAHRLFEKSDPDAETREISRPPPPQNTLAPCPRIYTRCPACNNSTLTIYEGHLLCTWIGCPDPTLIHTGKPKAAAPCPIKDEGEETAKLGIPEALEDRAQAVLQKALSLLQAAEDDALTCVERPTEASAIHTHNAVQAVTSVLKCIALGTPPVTQIQEKPDASPATTGKGPMDGIGLIAAERQRQLYEEQWTPAHDDYEHDNGDLALAGACYAKLTKVLIQGVIPFEDISNALCDTDWPWGDSSFKPSVDPIRNLEKAGALIAAEIDRLLRKAPSEGRVTDEHGGLPVTPNSSSPASTQGVPTVSCVS